MSLFPVSFSPFEKRNFREKNITYKKLFFRIRAIDALGLEHGPSRGLFLESPENFSGPKSQLSHCNPLVLKRWSFNMFLTQEKLRGLRILMA